MHIPITSNTDLTRPTASRRIATKSSAIIPEILQIGQSTRETFDYKLQPGAATAATQRVVSLGCAGIMLVVV